MQKKLYWRSKRWIWRLCWFFSYISSNAAVMEVIYILLIIVFSCLLIIYIF